MPILFTTVVILGVVQNRSTCMTLFRLRDDKNIAFIFSSSTEILTSEECNNEPIVQLTFHQRIFKLPDLDTTCAYCQAPANPQSTLKFCKNCYRVSYCDE